ncbi:hypothetical protein [Aquimarina sp. MMG016]|uniref:hypothetical protein n=1 Tax=Aquimarina sp. MMG016 TaxID=2822690 RepID=UPI001B39F36D|nr:hypothetical protein [Aquimarina sp. MMG016]MBQ4819163.1 hypothetical protein [Aquimarina sp. MMG016]
MFKFILLLYLSLLTQTLSAQQFLWTTAKGTDLNNIPIENVTDEVLNYYEFYDFYSDGSGYSKSNFLKMLEKYIDGSDDEHYLRKLINDTEKLTVFALKDNLGQGSVVLIIIINSRGVDIVAFTNNLEADSILATPYDKEKFKKWFNSLLN